MGMDSMDIANRELPAPTPTMYPGLRHGLSGLWHGLCRAVLAALALVGLATAALAGPNLVQNGTFSGFNAGANTAANSCNFGSTGTAAGMAQLSNCDLPNWWSTGVPSGGNYTFILPAPYTQGSSNFTTTNGSSLGLRGPGNTNGAVIPVPPSGASQFLATDGAFQQSYTYTTITGLIVGYTYNITFNMAASQQAGSQFNGPTSDWWQVGLSTGTPGCSIAGNNTGSPPGCQPNTGTTTSAITPTIVLPTTGAGQGFSGWVGEEITLVASAANEVLWFFGESTALQAQPPFLLLDGVSLTVPEPPAYGVLMVALLGLLGVRRAYRRKG